MNEWEQYDSNIGVLDKTDDGTGSDSELGFRVILYNDDYHTMDEVVKQLMLALKCGAQKAFTLMLNVHSSGKGIVYEGEKKKAKEVATILRKIRLQVEVFK